MTEMGRVENGKVIKMDYTLKVDGQVMDTSSDHGPIEFIQGAGNIIPGLEKELYGMSVGESKNVIVPASEGYGEVDSEAYTDVPKDQFPSQIPLEVGTELELHDQQGHPLHARIDKVNDQTVRLDFNHPLAGKDLVFDVKIAGLREPTEEEKEHGHVHGEGHDHSEE